MILTFRLEMAIELCTFAFLTFTFMHLAWAFIHRNLQCIHDIKFIHSLGMEPMILVLLAPCLTV